MISEKPRLAAAHRQNIAPKRTPALKWPGAQEIASGGARMVPRNNEYQHGRVGLTGVEVKFSSGSQPGNPLGHTGRGKRSRLNSARCGNYKLAPVKSGSRLLSCFSTLLPRAAQTLGRWVVGVPAKEAEKKSWKISRNNTEKSTGWVKDDPEEYCGIGGSARFRCCRARWSPERARPSSPSPRIWGPGSSSQPWRSGISLCASGGRGVARSLEPGPG